MKSEVFFFFLICTHQHYCSFFPLLPPLLLVMPGAPSTACYSPKVQRQDRNLATSSRCLCTLPPLVPTNPETCYHCFLKPGLLQTSQSCWAYVPRSLPSLQRSQRGGKHVPTSVFCSDKGALWWKWPGPSNFRSWVPSHGCFLSMNDPTKLTVLGLPGQTQKTTHALTPVKWSPTLPIKSLSAFIWGQDTQKQSLKLGALGQLIYWRALSGEGREAAPSRGGAKQGCGLCWVHFTWPQGELWSRNSTTKLTHLGVKGSSLLYLLPHASRLRAIPREGVGTMTF